MRPPSRGIAGHREKTWFRLSFLSAAGSTVAAEVNRPAAN